MFGANHHLSPASRSESVDERFVRRTGLCLVSWLVRRIFNLDNANPDFPRFSFGMLLVIQDNTPFRGWTLLLAWCLIPNDSLGCRI